MKVHDEVESDVQVDTQGRLVETPIDRAQEMKFLRGILDGALSPSEFKFVEVLPHEGPRAGMIYDWGLEDGEKQENIFKIDRMQIKSPVAQKHYTSGCTTGNEINIMVALDPSESSKHHISPMLGFYPIVKDEKVYKVYREKFFRNYTSLESILPELKEDPLNKKEFEKITASWLDALAYIDGKGIYHRDFSLRNVITNLSDVRKNTSELESKTKETNIFNRTLIKTKEYFKKKFGQQSETNLESVVTDFANACFKTHTTAKFDPTMGARQIADPLMVFSDEEIKYGDQQEIYAFCKNAAEMLLGYHITTTDPISKTIVDSQGNPLAIGSDVDIATYNNTWREALSKLPRFAKKMAPVLYKGISGNPEDRYLSTAEFVKEWKKHSKKDAWGRTKSIAAKVVGGAMIISQIGLVYNLWIDHNTPKLVEVTPVINKETSEVENNYLKLDVDMCYNNSYNIIGSTPKNPRKFLAPQGEKLFLTVHAKYQPIDKNNRINANFLGRAYIEGDSSKAQEFHVYPVEPGFKTDMPLAGYYDYIGNIGLPADAQEGSVRNLIIELYPAQDTAYVDTWDNEAQTHKNIPKVLFDKSKPIVRKSIALIATQPGSGKVRDSTIAVGFEDFDNQMNYPQAVYFRNLLSDDNFVRLNPNIRYAFVIPELGYQENFTGPDTWNSNSRFMKPELPAGPDNDTLTLQTIAYKDGKILNQSFIPLARSGTHSIKDDPKNIKWFSTYDLTVPNKNFMNKTQQYARQAKMYMK